MDWENRPLFTSLLSLCVVATALPAWANNPPNAPVYSSPGPGQLNRSLCTSLFWSASDPDGDAVTYDVYFGSTSPPPLVSSNQVNGVYPSPGLQPASTYWWRIVVRDEHGAETSGPEVFFATKATNGPPSAPASPSPPDNAANQPYLSTLDWFTADADGNCHQTHFVYFGTNLSPPHVATVFDSEFDPGPLQFETTYYWRIVTRDHLGLETLGPMWTFITKANSPPNPPSQPHPLTGQAGGTNAQLSWTCSDIDEQTLRYFVYFGTSGPLPLVASNVLESTFDPGPLQPGVTYYWMIVAFDGIAFNAAPMWSFTARIPGDVVPDNVLTNADAACAMQVYLSNPSCGDPGGYVRADANCDGNVTPGDARCIHREALELGCDICEDAVAPAPPQESSVVPEVSLSSWLIDDGTLILRLAASGISQLNAFGLYTWTWPRVPVLNAEPRAASNHFDEWHSRAVSQFTFVGGYSLADQPLGADAEFIELHYDISGGMPDAIAIDGFVDDLGGANQLYLNLDTMVDAPPIPTTLALHQNYPNPFNPVTTIAYDLPVARATEHVRLQIVDVTGRVVRTLVDKEQPEGRYRVSWEGRDDRGESVASGVYFSVLHAHGVRQTRKLVLLK